MTTDQFKGQPGGDPSRRPPMFKVEYSCQSCGKMDSKMTTTPKKFTPPPFCCTPCKAMAQFEPLAREAVRNRLGKELPAFNLVGTGIFRSVCKYENLIRLAEKNPSKVQRYRTKCLQCEQTTDHYRESQHEFSKKSYFCTASCGNSSKAGLPLGVSCPHPAKLRFATEADAVEGVKAANSDLVSDGEEEMVAYHCSCGTWHFGHLSKAIASDEITEARAGLIAILDGLIP